MEKHGSALCALVLTLVAFLNFDIIVAASVGGGVKGIVPKTGHCPRLLTVVPSRKDCACDEECPADHKCCVFDCEAVCVPPAFTKPGVCPRHYGSIGICVELCSNDNDCPDMEKCCFNGCGHQCTAPYTVKPGRCGLPKGTQMCAEFCQHDGDCPGQQKCCATTCGHTCSEPC